MSDKDKNFYRSMHDYGWNGLHGFNSRGIAPSFLGSDSLPQGLADLHWALHGLQGNMDMLDTRMKAFENNIIEISDDMKDDVIKYIGDKLMASKTPLTNETGYISKMLTTRTHIFSDSFGPETQMDPRQRIRGFTENYQWISYNVKNPTCEGEYDKIIDYTFISDHQQNDGVDSQYVTKGKLTLDKCGLINRIFVTQIGTNIVLYYLLTQSVPTQTGVGYTGAIKRVEYTYDGDLVSDSYVSLNHTPLIMLGAFSSDANNEQDFIQYISTDYKLYQNYNGTDLLLGELPIDVINLIDPVNDLVSDSKQAYIITYTNDGKIKFPLEGFTLVDTMTKDEIIPKFKIIKFENDTELFKSFVSISPRNQTTLTRKFDPTQQVVVEGGYYIELYDDNTTKPNVSASHIFLLSSTEEVYDLDRFASNILDYRSTKPSEFSLHQERDYTEFRKITFESGLKKMFPELIDDFGIPENTSFTVEFDNSRRQEIVTVHLSEPFVITRDISSINVNKRNGFTVLRNSDNLRDVGTVYNLSLYKGLDFVVHYGDVVKDYYKYLKTYDESKKPNWGYFRIRTNYLSQDDGVKSSLIVEHFNGGYLAQITINPTSNTLSGSIHINDNRNINNSNSTNESLLVKSEYLADLTETDTLYLNLGTDNASKYKDSPYKAVNGTLITRNLFGSSHQTLYTLEISKSDNTDQAITIFERLNSENGEASYGEWFGHGTTLSPKYLHIAGNYNSKTGYSATILQSENPNHNVFKNIVSHNFDCEAVNEKYVHVDYTITNNIGLIMHYHNIAIRADKNGRIPRTAQPYTLMYSKWIPGEYVGNAANPYGPDTNAFDKEILRRITNLEVQDIEVQDTPSVNLTKLGDWQDNNPSEIWNPATQSWTVDPNTVIIKADSKLSTGTKQFTNQFGTYTLQNSIVINNDGLFSPDYNQVITKLSNELKDTQDDVTNLEAQDIEVQDTQSVNLTKLGDWQDNNSTVIIKADSKLSSHTENVSVTLPNGEGSEQVSIRLPNSITVKTDGLYSPDQSGLISRIISKITDIRDYFNNKINKIVSDITNIKNMMETLKFMSSGQPPYKAVMSTTQPSYVVKLPNPSFPATQGVGLKVASVSYETDTKINTTTWLTFNLGEMMFENLKRGTVVGTIPIINLKANGLTQNMITGIERFNRVIGGVTIDMRPLEFVLSKRGDNIIITFNGGYQQGIEGISGLPRVENVSPWVEIIETDK